MMPIQFVTIGLSSLVIFVYIASELASERETKSREGMKIMGLQDGTYYLGWFILFIVFAMYNSTVATIVFKLSYLSRVNVILIFVTPYRL